MSPRTIRLSRFAFCLAMVLLAAGFTGPQALADPMYTVTNLGTGPITLTTATGSTVQVPSQSLYSTGTAEEMIQAAGFATSQFVSVSNGVTSYSFPTTPDTVPGQSIFSNIPPPTPLTALDGLMNNNGSTAISGLYFVASNPNLSYDVAYSLQQTSNGSWSQAALITTGPVQVFSPGEYLTIVGLNKQAQSLFFTSYPSTNYGALLYSANTQTLTNLATLPVLSSGPFSNVTPIAIDDQGRILLYAVDDGSNRTDTLLLTPEGVTSDPLPLSTPEPATMLTWGLICGIVAVVGHEKGT